MSAEDDAVASLLRFEAQFRGILSLAPRLREAGSMQALADQAQQKLNTITKDLDGAKGNLDAVRAQAASASDKAKHALAEADDYRAKVKAECDEMRAQAKQAADAAEQDGQRRAQAAIKERQAEHDAAENEIIDVDRRISQKKADLTALNDQIKESEKKLQQTQDALAQLKANLPG